MKGANGSSSYKKPSSREPASGFGAVDYGLLESSANLEAPDSSWKTETRGAIALLKFLPSRLYIDPKR